jgi:hypothetical protein
MLNPALFAAISIARRIAKAILPVICGAAWFHAAAAGVFLS